jgi:DNA repair exonuclease SbcCD nuclease subunit
MPNLFRKAAFFTDIHFGDKNDSEQHNQDCIEFIQWFIKQVKGNDCDAVIFLGDYLDNSKITNNLTLHYANHGLELINNIGVPVYHVIGNHDLFYKHTRLVHSLPYLHRYPNITVINDVIKIGECIFAPWLLQDEYALVTEQSAKYVFGHFELPLFLVNQMVECHDRGGLTMDHFYQCDAVFSGHYHLRQLKINKNNIPVTYIGNPFGHDYNDVGDRERGMMVLPWDQEPVFINYTEGPNYNRIQLSELFDIIESDRLHEVFNTKSVVECYDDLNIGIEATLQIKESLQGVVRRFVMPEQQDDLDIENADIDLASDTETIEVLVERNLAQLDTSGGKYNNDRLVQLWQEADE